MLNLIKSKNKASPTHLKINKPESSNFNVELLNWCCKMTKLIVVTSKCVRTRMFLPSFLTFTNGIWQHGCTVVQSGTSQPHSCPPQVFSMKSLQVLFLPAWLFSSHRNIHIRLIRSSKSTPSQGLLGLALAKLITIFRIKHKIMAGRKDGWRLNLCVQILQWLLKPCLVVVGSGGIKRDQQKSILPYSVYILT